MHVQYDQLKKLVGLFEQGLLTEVEFNDAKSALISASNSGVEISKEEPVSPPDPDPTSGPTLAPESGSISEEAIKPVSNKDKFDNYGRPAKPDFDQYGRSNRDNNTTSIAIGLGLIILFIAIIGIVTNQSGSNTNPAVVNSTNPRQSPKYAGNKSSKSNTSWKAQCAFQEVRGGPLVDHIGCKVNSRINANGHTVYDVLERDGYKRSVVLWQDSSVEVFASGNRYTGRWTDQGDQILININGGLFTFRH